MSFGFSLSDIIKVSELANKIRKEFVDAPSQFKAIADEVRSLSIVANDVEVLLSDRELRIEQEAELKQIANGCRNVLNQLEHTLEEYDELKSGHGSVNKRAKRIWKRLKWEPEDIEQLRSRISTNIGLLNAFTSGLTRDNVVSLVRSQEDQVRQTILHWITPIDYAERQSDVIRLRQAGTGQWLLDSAEFKAWVETDKRTLFCPGIPGAGKTILTSIVVEELFTRFENNGNIGIAYLYCNYQRQHEQNLEDLFASLLKQFVQEQSFIPDSVKTLYHRHKDKGTRPSLDEILGILQIVVAACSRIFIIADALDECQVSDGCRQRFLSTLFNLQEKCGANLFATSRPLSSIEKEFEGNSKLEIRASEEDVRRYLDGQLFQLPRFVARSLELQEVIKTAISSAVDGMFLLAKLHLESLIGKISPKAVRAALKNLATGSGAYDRVYKDIMERISGQVEDQEELAKQVLSWITCARRPLAIWEVQHALAVEIGEPQLDKENVPEVEDITSVCAGLVTVDEESNIIRLVHYTAQEYLERTQKCWFPEAETDIANTCVTYLSFDTFESGLCLTDEEFEARLRKNALYDYAARNWGHHARKASLTSQVIMEYLESYTKVEASFQAFMATKRYSSHANYSQEFPRDITGSHLAAHFGLEKAIKELLIRGHEMNLKDSDLRTPLSWAARSGHDAVIALFSAQNISGIDSKDNSGQTPLSHAAGNGHESAVKLLLTVDGVDPDSRDDFSQTPLFRAAGNGHESAVKLLLTVDGVDPDSRDNEFSQTPLFRAAANGHAAVVELLLAQDAVNPDAEDDDSETPLVLAARYGHDAVVKLLLDTGRVVPESKDTEYGRTPLSWVAGRGNAAVVEKLLEIDGIDPDSKSAGSYVKNRYFKNRYVKNRTPLSYASEGGHQTVVELLMATGRVDLDSKDNNNRTPLSYATEGGHQTVVELLMATGRVNLDSKDNNNRTPLSYATEGGHQTVVELLMATGRVNLDSKDNNNRTPLSYATEWGHQTVVELLMATGRVNLDSKDNNSRTPLSYAIAEAYTGTIHSLLRYGASPTTIDIQLKSLLHHAIVNLNCSLDIVKKLLMLDAPTNLVDIDNMTPLHHTVKFDRQDIAELLIQNGVPVDIAIHRKAWMDETTYEPRGGHEILSVDRNCTRGLTPLHYAALIGNCQMVQFFLDHGADPNAVSDCRETPLHLTLHKDVQDDVQGLRYYDDWTEDCWRRAFAEDDDDQRIAVVDALLHHPKVDLKIQDNEGASALHRVPYGEPKCAVIVSMLIEKGAEVSAWNSKKQCPLHLACEYGDYASMQVLLNHGADILHVDQDGLNAVHYAATSGSAETLSRIIEASDTNGLNISTSRDESGRNALHHMLDQPLGASIEGVRLLLDKGVDVKDRDINGNSPLASHLINSWLSDDNGICRLLLQSGSDALTINDQGLALTHLAARCLKKIPAVLEALMDFGVDIEILDTKGRSLLHHIALEGPLTETVLAFLFDKTKLRFDDRDFSGKTPLQYAAEEARKKRHRDVWDPQRWSNTLEIFMRNEAVAG
ncbi:MAG: hypothetical protein M1825_001842 [Sarcosagium campestre]|nr:MAG: hypothetical protein M1825_001842 [Sarcosagium campestre]